MLVTLDGIVIFVKLPQFSNDSSPMLVTLDGIVILVKLTQFSNDSSPILVTLDGILMFSTPAVPKKV